MARRVLTPTDEQVLTTRLQSAGLGTTTDTTSASFEARAYGQVRLYLPVASVSINAVAGVGATGLECEGRLDYSLNGGAGWTNLVTLNSGALTNGASFVDTDSPVTAIAIGDISDASDILLRAESEIVQLAGSGNTCNITVNCNLWRIVVPASVAAIWV